MQRGSEAPVLKREVVLLAQLAPLRAEGRVQREEVKVKACDPKGPPTGLINDSRLMRGCSFYLSPQANANARCSWPPDSRLQNIDMGFRPVCNARRK
jgi:hypothetical protein